MSSLVVFGWHMLSWVVFGWHMSSWVVFGWHMSSWVVFGWHNKSLLKGQEIWCVLGHREAVKQGRLLLFVHIDLKHVGNISGCRCYGPVLSECCKTKYLYNEKTVTNETTFLLMLCFEFVMKHVSEINYHIKIHFLNILMSCLDLFRKEPIISWKVTIIWPVQQVAQFYLANEIFIRAFEFLLYNLFQVMRDLVDQAKIISTTLEKQN